MEDEVESLDICDARRHIGHLWGLNRELTRMELARALRLSPKHGGDFVSKLEKGAANQSGTLIVAIQAFIDGYVPRHMASVVKPGYPRGR